VLATAKAVGFEETDRKIQHLSGSAKKSMSNLVVAAAALGPALVPIGAVAAGGALAFGGLGAAGILALQGIKAEMKSGTPLGSQYLLMVNVLKTHLAGLEHVAAGGVLTGFKSALQKITPMLPAVSGEVGKLAGVFGDIASHVLPALVGLFVKASPLMNTFAGYADTLATKFEAWATNSTGPQRFMQYAADNLPAVAGTIEDAAKAVGHLVGGLGPLGGLSLSSIGAFARFANMIPLPVLQVLAPTIAGIIVATKLWAAAQAALDVALAANPITLVALALVALGAGLTLLWQNWDKTWKWMGDHKIFAAVAAATLLVSAPFILIAVGLEALAKNWKRIWGDIEHATKIVALTIALFFMQDMVRPVVNAVADMIHAFAVAFGDLPFGVGKAFKAADRKAQDFRTSVDKKIHGLQVGLDTEKAVGKLHDFKAQLALLHDKTISIRTYVDRVITPDVRKTYSQHAAGGKFSDGWNLYGERGPEWAYKRGSTVQMYPTGSGGPSSIASPVVMPSGGSGDVNIIINVSGSVLSNEDLKRAMARGLTEWARSGHTLPIGKAIRP
jgi:hypothetical protein